MALRCRISILLRCGLKYIKKRNNGKNEPNWLFIGLLYETGLVFPVGHSVKSID